MCISIIIPVLNEEKVIEACIKQVLALEGKKEIIVVDGGSTDETLTILRKYPCIVIQSKKGRANQMNMGASVATGDILWFVHVDSILHRNSLIEINQAIKEGVDGGSFRLYFTDSTLPLLKFIQVTSNLRAKYLKLIFGDQGLFIRKESFFTINGFLTIELMEDWDFSRRIHQVANMKQLSLPIGTSARRFINNGPFKTFLKMQWIKILYILGVSPKTLVKIYK